MTRTRDGLNIPEKLIRRKQLRNNIRQSKPELTEAQLAKRVAAARQLNGVIEVGTLDQSNELYGWEYPAHDGAVI